MRQKHMPGWVVVAAIAISAASGGCAMSDDIADDIEAEEWSIVGGTVANAASYPWVVRVQGDLSCHGTLIAPRWVLTAAHCVDQSFQQATVSYSRVNPTTGAATSGSRQVPWSAISLHAGWNASTLDNDIALLRLPTAFAPDPLLQHAELPIRRTSAADPLVMASGSPGPGQVNVLSGTGSPGTTSLLVNGGPARACTGDSGSGVIARSGGVNHVVGVASAASIGSDGCGLPGTTLDATYVVKYLDWIGQRMQTGPPPFTAGFKASASLYPDSYDFGMPSPYETITADFNGDGKADHARVGPTGAYLYFGAAGGSFTAGFQSYDGLDFGMPSSWTTTVGDFNGDGRKDYARLGATGAWVFFGNASRTFTTTFHAYPGLNFGQPTTWQTATADFNGDGREDYARLGATGAWVYYGSSGGAFTQTFHAYPGLDFGQPTLWQLATGDFNGDGRKDYARIGNTGAWVYHGNSNRTFTQTFHAYASGWDFWWPSPFELVVGDFNGDGRTDYRRLNGKEIYTFLGTSSGFTQHWHHYADLDFGLPSPWKTLTADFNGDGRMDFARLGDTGAFFFFGTSTGATTSLFQDYERHFGLPSTFTTIAGDFDGNGKADYARLAGVFAQVYMRQ